MASRNSPSQRMINVEQCSRQDNGFGPLISSTYLDIDRHKEATPFALSILAWIHCFVCTGMAPSDKLLASASSLEK